MNCLFSFFLSRPKSACIFLAVIAVSGIAGLVSLPISDYPESVPTVVNVSTTYAGASPKVVADTVATPIENEINTVDNVEHFESNCNDSGSYSLSITFKPGTDPDINLVNVQNAVKRAEPKLPGEVVQLGINVQKTQSDYMLRFGFTAEDGADLYLLGNFACTEIKEALQRVEGVSRVVSSSSGDYAMRVWLDSVKMDSLGISVLDVRSAISQQNIQPAAGNVGNSFASSCLSYKINVAGRLVSPEEFAAIVIRSDLKTGARVLLGDVARCELGVKSYDSEPRSDGKPAFVLSVNRDPEANMMETAKRCKAVLAEWLSRLPQGGHCVILQDSTAFTGEFIGGLMRGLLAAAVTVVAVFCLLGRGPVPLCTAAVMLFTLLGTAAVMWVTGVSVNAFTLLGLLFAFVHIAFNAASAEPVPRDGSWTGRPEVKSGPEVLSTAVVLAAYAPVLFCPDMVGMMYRSFAQALCLAVVISSILSLAVFPSLVKYVPTRTGDGLFGGLQAKAGRFLSEKYGACLRFVLRRPVATLLLSFFALGCFLLPVMRIEKEFVPKEERDNLMIECELSEGSSLSRTRETVERVRERLQDMPGIVGFFSAAASSHLGRVGENRAEITLRLAPWSERLSAGLTRDAIASEIERRLRDVYNARFTLLYPADLNGLGSCGGVTAYLCALQDDGPVVRAADADAYADWLRSLPQVKAVATKFSADTPQLNLSVDRDKAQALGVPVNSIFSTLQSKLAGLYVNDFNLRGGAYQVVIQNAPDDRRDLSDVYDIWIPGGGGAMVPLSSIGKAEYVLGPRVITRFNKFSSAGIVVTPADGVSSLEIVDLMEKNPPDPSRYVLNWSTVTMQEISNRGRTEMLILASLAGIGIVLIMVYESWRLALLSVFIAVFVAGAGHAGVWLVDGRLSVYSALSALFVMECQVCGMVAAFMYARQAEREGLTPEAAAEYGFRRTFPVNVRVIVSFLAGLSVFMMIDPAGVGAATRQGMATLAFFGMAAIPVVGLQIGAVAYVFSAKRRKREGRQPTSLPGLE